MNSDIKMNLRNISCDIERWIKPSRNLVQWRSFVFCISSRVLIRDNYRMETDVRFPTGAGVFLFVITSKLLLDTFVFLSKEYSVVFVRG
jgi:hypothetical protein